MRILILLSFFFSFSTYGKNTFVLYCNQSIEIDKSIKKNSCLDSKCLYRIYSLGFGGFEFKGEDLIKGRILPQNKKFTLSYKTWPKAFPAFLKKICPGFPINPQKISKLTEPLIFVFHEKDTKNAKWLELKSIDHECVKVVSKKVGPWSFTGITKTETSGSCP